MQTFSEMLPLTHVVRIVRGLIIYGRAESFFYHISILIACTLVFMMAACVAVNRRLVD
jgi:ABC-type polysaccharide/polyol phosphate export permease